MRRVQMIIGLLQITTWGVLAGLVVGYLTVVTLGLVGIIRDSLDDTAGLLLLGVLVLCGLFGGTVAFWVALTREVTQSRREPVNETNAINETNATK
jgi:hypothetical protein